MKTQKMVVVYMQLYNAGEHYRGHTVVKRKLGCGKPFLLGRRVASRRNDHLPVISSRRRVGDQ